MTTVELLQLNRIESFAQKMLKDSQKSHNWDHVTRVVQISDRLAALEKADPFIVRASALLHDIARPLEHETAGKLCHAVEGSRIAKDFLKSLAIDNQKIDHIADCIKTHRYRNELQPESIEAKIIFDADKLDSIGAIGIGRAFLFAGEVGAKLHNDLDQLNAIDQTAAYSADDTAYREYMVKLRFVKEQMQTSSGRKIAENRDKFMHLFFKQLENELKGNS